MSRSLVMQGEVGAGKTALLEYAIELANDFRVARVVGVESEMELGVRGPSSTPPSLPRGVDRLPAPERDALGSAFGLTAGTVPDPFLVGRAASSTRATQIARSGAPGTGMVTTAPDNVTERGPRRPHRDGQPARRA